MKRVYAGAVTGLLAVAGLLVLGAGPAAGQAPDATGWWSIASQSGQDAPPPPDMSDGDLLVQGGDLGGSAPDLGLPTSPSAVAALRFVVDDGADVGALTLAVGSGARAGDVRAYTVKKDDWKASKGGPMADAPRPDTRRYSQGALNADGTALVFRDIARLLADDGTLSVVLYPGASDRVVLKKPTAGALAVTAAGGGFAPPAGGGGSSGGAVAPVSGGGTTTLPPLSSGTAPGPVVDPGVVPPAVAGGPVTQPAPQVATGPVPAPRAATSDLAARTRADERTRYLVGLEALLVLATFGLLGWGPLSRLRGLTGASVVEGTPARGVGRFVQERSGEVVRL